MQKKVEIGFINPDGTITSKEYTEEELDNMINSVKEDASKYQIEKANNPIVKVPEEVMKPAVLFDDYNIYTVGNCTPISSTIYNTFGNINYELAGFANRDDYMNLTTRGLITASTVSNISDQFTMSIENIYNVMITKLGTMIHEFDTIDFASIIKLDGNKFEEVIGAIILQLVEYKSIDYIAIQNTVLAYVNYFGTSVYNYIRYKTTKFVNETRKTPDEVSYIFETINSEFGRAMGDITYEVSVFLNNLANNEPLIHAETVKGISSIDVD